MFRKISAATAAAFALQAAPALAVPAFDSEVYASGPAPLVYGSEPVALKICNANNYFVKLIVDGAEVRPRARACVVVAGKDIQTERISGAPAGSTFLINVQILGVKGTHDD